MTMSWLLEVKEKKKFHLFVTFSLSAPSFPSFSSMNCCDFKRRADSWRLLLKELEVSAPTIMLICDGGPSMEADGTGLFWHQQKVKGDGEKSLYRSSNNKTSHFGTIYCFLIW